MATVEKHGIIEPLVKLKVPIGSLDTLPGNARRGDVEAVARSYTIFGQRKPLVAKRTGNGGIVTAGNHGLLAARSLGWTHVAAVILDDDDTTAKAYALADNRTHDLGGYDDAALLALLEDVKAHDGLDGTGYDEGDLATLMDSIAGSGDDGPGGNGLGNPIISFSIIFDTVEQQNAWYDLVRMLRALYDDDSLGARIQSYVEHLRSTGDLE